MEADCDERTPYLLPPATGEWRPPKPFTPPDSPPVQPAAAAAGLKFSLGRRLEAAAASAMAISSPGIMARGDTGKELSARDRPIAEKENVVKSRSGTKEKASYAVDILFGYCFKIT